MNRRRSPGEGSIRERPDRKRWEAAVVTGYKPNGDPIRAAKTFKTKSEAQRWLEVTKQRITSVGLSSTQYKLSEFVNEWLTGITRRRRTNTAQNYTVIMKKYVLPHLGNIKLQDLKPIHIAQWINKLETVTTAHIVYRAHQYLGMVLNQALKLELISRNPTHNTRPPKPERAELERWTPAEVRDVLKYIAHHTNITFCTYVRLGLVTGMRKEELRGVRETDVFFKPSRIIEIRQTVTSIGGRYTFGSPKTKASKRDLFYDEETEVMLREQIVHNSKLRNIAGRRWQEHGLLLTSEVGTPVQDKSLRRWWSEMIEATGVTRIRIYDLRSTWGSTAMAHIGNPKTVSKRLGHTDVKFTMQTYIRPDKQEMQDAAKSLSELYNEKEVS